MLLICQPQCYKYAHPLAMNFFNLDVKEMFVDKLNFSISNYDGKVYYKMDLKGIIVVAHAVDDFTILSFTPISLFRTKIKQFWDLEVSRDRLKKIITLKQEGNITPRIGNDNRKRYSCHCVTTTNVQERYHANNIMLTDSEITLYQRKIYRIGINVFVQAKGEEKCKSD